MAYDLVIRGGKVVTAAGALDLEIGVVDGRIVELAPEVTGQSGEEIDADGAVILPAVIDAHVHFNEPGRTEWEGIESGSAAVAAGGGSCFFDMPLNASPPTIDGASFDLKLEAARAGSVTDFGLWGGLVPGNLDHLEELADRGVVGFKAFMTESGIEDFLFADEETLQRGMEEAARLGLPVAVHAESDAMIGDLNRLAIAEKRNTAHDFICCRPVEAEVQAIRAAIDIAEETGCSLHIVHVSSASGVAVVAEARDRGVDVTCETCPHYLYLSDQDLDRLGAAAKCAPPLRSPQEVDRLWEAVLEGEVDLIASDHSPSPPWMKESLNFFEVWGGIAGCQSMLAVMLAAGHLERGLPLEKLARLLASSPASRFGIEGKGRIEVGYDADLVLVDLANAQPLLKEDLFYRHAFSPYIGEGLHGFVRRTLVRGRTVFADGRLTAERVGRLLRPAQA